MKLDLGEVFRLSPNAYMVLDRELRYVAANETYLRLTASTLESLLGKHVLDRFPNDPADPNNEGALMLRASFARVLATRAIDVLAFIPYRVPLKTPEGVVDELRYWSATHTPLLDERGEVAFVLQHTVDVTELHRLRAAANSAEAGARAPMEAGVLQRAMRVQDENRLLGEERRRLLDLFEQAPSFMTYMHGPEHVFEIANASYLGLVGGRPLIGRSIREALPELAGQGFFELLDQVFTTGVPYVGRGTRVALQRKPDAPLEDVFVDFIYHPIRGAGGEIAGVFVQGHDVTEMKRAEAALRESEERFRRMADDSPVMLWLTDATGVCTYLSRAFKDFAGAGGASTHEAWLASVHPDDAAAFTATVADAHARRRAFRAELRLRTRDGAHHWVVCSASPRHDAAGEFLGVAGSFVDIHDQKLVERQIRELNEELERRVAERTAELAEANKELESFSYSVSHDLRAPLRHITGFAQLLERRAGKELDPVARGYLETISSAAKEGGKLVDDLLAFSRMGRAEMKTTSIDLGALISDLRRELEPEAAKRVVHWRVSELPELTADPVLLRSALKNLLANALKYTRPRAEAVIEVGARADDAETHVWIRDNGVGFDMQYVDKLFGVFQRLHGVDAFEGTGIGLANVRRIITRHGGRVWAEGRVDEGATFHFALPNAWRDSAPRAPR